MNILILDESYPSPENLYGDVFVHVRAKEYQKRGHTVTILQFFKKTPPYVFEGIPVESVDNVNDVISTFQRIAPDVVAIHFFHRDLHPFVAQLEVPCFVWVHGYEATGWYRRLFNFGFSDWIHLRTIVQQNLIQQWQFRKLTTFATRSGKLSFIFPSAWLRRTVETDTGTTLPRAHVVPNPISTKTFPYVEKHPDQVRKFLSIRPYTTRKYANDITVDFILSLRSKPYFRDLTFTLCGHGALFDRTVKPLRALPNVTLINRFLSHAEVGIAHRDHGIFLCPTRQDSQGVSSCEAMASGLVPFSSNNSAVPEFIQHGVTGFLHSRVSEMVQNYETLLNDTDLFMKMSRSASLFVQRTCDLEVIVGRELAMFMNVSK